LDTFESKLLPALRDESLTKIPTLESRSLIKVNKRIPDIWFQKIDAIFKRIDILLHRIMSRPLSALTRELLHRPIRLGRMKKKAPRERKVKAKPKEPRVFEQHHVDKIMAVASVIGKLSEKVEVKQPVRSTKSGEPIKLGRRPDYKLMPTEETKLLVGAARGLFGNKMYKFRLSTSLTVAATSTGFVNAAVNVAVVEGIAEFASLAGLFNEFFVKKMHLRYEPASMYNGPLGFNNEANISSLPIGICDLQHFQPIYPSLTSMANNFRFKYANTGRPWNYTWINTEKSSQGVLPNPGSTDTPTQSWCLCTNAADYSGTVQFISISGSDLTLPLSTDFGNIVVDFDLLFRVRL